MQSFGACGKNYINCRKHPARFDLSPAQRYKNDMKHYRAELETQAGKIFDDLTFAAQIVEQDIPRLNKLQRRYDQTQDLIIATLPDAKFAEWVENQTIQIDSAIGFFALAEAEKLKTVTKLRKKQSDALQHILRLEAEIPKYSPLSESMIQLASVFTASGEVRDKKQLSRSDSRGTVDGKAERHLRHCFPAAFHRIQETGWNLKPLKGVPRTFQGLSAEITCSCGNIHRKQVFIKSEELMSLA